jgi:hypothetical protein
VSTTVRPLETRLTVHTRSVRSLELDTLARDAGVHPELLRRLVSLGFGDPLPGPLQLRRAIRLRRDLGLNYAGALLAGELLDRIDELERRLRRYESKARTNWTRTS